MIYTKPSELIDDYFDYVVGKPDPKLLAEDEKENISVWMYDDDGFPKILVTVNDAITDAVSICDYRDAEREINRIYDSYINGEDETDMEDARDQDLEIAYREDELDWAIEYMLSIFTEESEIDVREKYGNIVSKLKEHLCEWLYKECDIDLYRPMVLVDDETGEEFYNEYPYTDLLG